MNNNTKKIPHIMQNSFKLVSVVLLVALLVATVAYANSGDLDPAFGLSPENPHSGGNAVAIQTDGKIVAVGYSHTGKFFNFGLARYNSDGSLDAGFGTNGMVTTSVGGTQEEGSAVAIQSNGKIVVAGASFVGSTEDFSLARYNSDGNLDTTFDMDGKVTTSIGSSNDEGNAIAIQSDGKIVVAGTSYISGNRDFALARYNSNGILDTTFDTDGIVTTPIGSSHDDAYAVAIQSDGKIVVAGYIYNGSNEDFALARYNSDGSLDTAGFGSGNGYVTTPIGGAGNRAYGYAVAIQSDAKIVVAGKYDNGSNDDFALARYNSDGSLDTTFDTDGIVTTPVGSSSETGNAITIQSGGKIVVAGFAHNGIDYDFALARYDSDGNLDATFDTDGKTTTPIGSSNDEGNGVALQADGKIVVVGNCAQVVNGNFALARYNSDGSLDTTFDTDGKVTTSVYSRWGYVTTPIGSDAEEGKAVAIQSDGKIVLAGYSKVSGYWDFALARYNIDGSLDTTFDTDGKVTTPIGGNDYGHAVAIQSDGKIVVAGHSDSPMDIALARYNSDGSLDTTFDVDGIVTTNIGYQDRAFAVAIQSDGKIVVAGNTFNTVQSDVLLARYNSDGSLDTTFDTDGVVTTSIGSDDDDSYSVAIQADGKIVVAGETDNGSTYDFALVRYNSDGSLDTTFDTDGKVTTSIGSYGDCGYAVAVQSNGKIVVAGYTETSDSDGSEDFALVRYNSDGSLDTTFDTDGIVTTLIGADDDRATDVATQYDGKIIVVGYRNTPHYFVLARYDSDGSLDTTFDVDGIVTTHIGNYDSGEAVAIQTDGKIVVGGYSNTGSSMDFALARYDVVENTTETVAFNGTSTSLPGLTIINHSGSSSRFTRSSSCDFTVNKYPVSPGGAPTDQGEMPIYWDINSNCNPLNVDIIFEYNDAELENSNNVTEEGLKVLKKIDSTAWMNQCSTYTCSLDTQANTLTVSGVTALSSWTLSSEFCFDCTNVYLPVIRK